MVSTRRPATLLASCTLSPRSTHATAAFLHSKSPVASIQSIPSSVKPTFPPSDPLVSPPRGFENPHTPSIITTTTTSTSRARRNFLLSSSAFALAALSSPRSVSAYSINLFSTVTASSSASSNSLSSPRNQKISPSALLANQNSCDSSTMMATSDELSTGYLNAEDAASLDAELMSTPGFSLEQLMELAGLSVAESVYQVAVMDAEKGECSYDGKKKHVLLVCGPGNNGGDGLVAARHLVHFGLDATIVYPKPSTKTHFINLIQQCKDMNIPVLDEIPMKDNPHYDVIVDAIFGFSFRGTAPREPFATAIQQMVQLQKQNEQSSSSLLVSVDVPSGWDVDGGDLTGTGFHPDVLVSLTAPKLSAKKFHGRHFVGGRFLPPAIAEKYGIRMPPYPGVAQMPPYPGLRHSMEVSKLESSVELSKEGFKAIGGGSEPEHWAAQYQKYLIEKEEELNKPRNLEKDEDAAITDDKTGAYTGDPDDWAAQYQAYLIEKEEELNNSRCRDNGSDLTKDGDGDIACSNKGTSDADTEDWAVQYQAYLIEKEEEINKAEEIDKSLSLQEEENTADTANVTSDAEDWAAQYQAYLIDKEEELNKAKKSGEICTMEKKSTTGGNNDNDTEDWAAQYHAYLSEKEEELNEPIRDNVIGTNKAAESAKSDDQNWHVEYAKYCEETEIDLYESYLG